MGLSSEPDTRILVNPDITFHGQTLLILKPETGTVTPNIKPLGLSEISCKEKGLNNEQEKERG